MLKRYDAFALKHPLGATVSFFGLLIVLLVVGQGLLRGWDRSFDYLGYGIVPAVAGGLPTYLTYRQRSKAEHF